MQASLVKYQSTLNKYFNLIVDITTHNNYRLSK
jgi:hypothetical protein